MPFLLQSCGFGVPLYDFVMHRTQLLRLADKFESGDRELAASRNRTHSDQGHDLPCATEDANDKGSNPTFSLHKYWLLKNASSLDGLPGLLTAPDAILDMAPQNNFDKDAPRPMLRRSTGVDNTTRDRRWFASGFVLGAVAVFAITRLAGGLKE